VQRRRATPLTLLALLALLTAAAAVLALTMAPNGATLAVQNGTAETLGSPPGATPFAVDLTSTVSAGAGAGSISQTRLIRYEPPDRMVVYRLGAQVIELGTLGPSAIRAALSGWAAIVAGPVNWVRHPLDFTRTETLVRFVTRVRPPSATPTRARGRVYEVAIVRDGLLVSLDVRIVVVRQSLGDGTVTSGGVESETFRFVQIDDEAPPALNP
jgi:hypothetical protein